MSAPIPIRYDSLESALLWSSAAPPFDNLALLSRATGELYFKSTYGDPGENLPPDIEDGSRYVAVPHKNDFDLGRELVLAFVDEHAPAHRQTVGAFFRQRRAYARFKTWLERHRLLDRWYAYEAAATRRALESWAADNGFVVMDGVDPPSRAMDHDV